MVNAKSDLRTYVCEAPFHSNTEISQLLQCEIGLEVEQHLRTYVHLCEPYTVGKG